MSKSAYDYSIRLLSKRDYSRFKLRNKLLQRGFEQDDIQEAMARLEANNFLREEEYTRIRVKMMLEKGYSNLFIQRKLEPEELYPTEEFINSLRGEYLCSSNQMIEQLIERKLRGKTIPSEFEAKTKLKNRVLNFLVSKGHSYQEIKNSVDKFFDERANS